MTLGSSRRALHVYCRIFVFSAPDKFKDSVGLGIRAPPPKPPQRRPSSRQPRPPTRQRSIPVLHEEQKSAPTDSSEDHLADRIGRSPAKIGNTASVALIFPDATSEATEIAAECVSTKPARAAATRMPVPPNHSRSAAEATRMQERVKANPKAAERLKARPLAPRPRSSAGAPVS